MSKKMTAAYWFAWLAIVLELLFATRLLFFSGHRGEYSEITRTYWCDRPTDCRHEEAHAMDHRLGWSSRTAVYKAALVMFSNTSHPWAPIVAKELRDRHSPTETYAEMYEMCGGESGMPEELRIFYEWR